MAASQINVKKIYFTIRSVGIAGLPHKTGTIHHLIPQENSKRIKHAKVKNKVIQLQKKMWVDSSITWEYGKTSSDSKFRNKKGKEWWIYFYKNKKTFVWQKKRISIVKDKVKKMFPTNGKKKTVKDFEKDDNKYWTSCLAFFLDYLCLLLSLG